MDTPNSDLSNCLICGKVCTQDELFPIIYGSGNAEGVDNACPPTDEGQLRIIFVLRKLLQLPQEICDSMISAHGNPVDWGTTFCLQCSEIIEDGQDLSYKITNNLQKFQCLQQRIQEELRVSLDEQSEDNCDVTSCPKPQPIREDVRRLCTDSLLNGPQDNFISSILCEWTQTRQSDHGNVDQLKKLFERKRFTAPSKPIEYLLDVMKHSPESENFEDQVDPDPDPCDAFIPGQNNVDPECVVKVISDELEEFYSTRHEPASKCSRGTRVKNPRTPKCFNSRSNRTSTKSGQYDSDEEITNIKKPHKKKVSCPMCNKLFQTVNFLNLHYRKIHMGVTSARDRSRSRVLQKKKINAEASKLKVRKGNEKDSDSELSEYESSSVDSTSTSSSYSPPFLVDSCQRQTRSNSSIDSNSKQLGTSHGSNSEPKKTKRERFQCTFEGCNQRFLHEIVRDGHFRQIHEGVEKPFKCTHEGCDKLFKKYFSLQIHKQSQHGSGTETFVCEACGKIYFNKIAFKRHLFFHRYKSAEKKHPCDECGRMFKAPSDVERHKLIHRDQPIPQCDICHTTLRTRLHLFNHKRTIHGIYDATNSTAIPFVCDQCGKSFTTGARLKKHVDVVHQQIFKFVCDVCKMGHADKSSFDRHMLSHSGVKPFICDLCGKGLTRSSDLARHMRLHTGEKPYKCDQCNELFTDASKLRKHMKTAHGEPTQICHTCGKKFYTYTQLRIHKMIHDPNHKKVRRRQSTTPLTHDVPLTTVQEKPKKIRKPRDPKVAVQKRGRPPKKQLHLSHDSSSENSHEFVSVPHFPSNFSLHQHGHHNQHSQYQIPSSSMYNFSQNPSASDLYRANASSSEFQGQMPQPQSTSHPQQSPMIRPHTYMDPNMYLMQLQHHLNPSPHSQNNNS